MYVQAAATTAVELCFVRCTHGHVWVGVRMYVQAAATIAVKLRSGSRIVGLMSFVLQGAQSLECVNACVCACASVHSVFGALKDCASMRERMRTNEWNAEALGKKEVRMHD
eukprot:1144524-Pelagomonas_calceolata.AAC.1